MIVEKVNSGSLDLFCVVEDASNDMLILGILCLKIGKCSE